MRVGELLQRQDGQRRLQLGLRARQVEDVLGDLVDVDSLPSVATAMTWAPRARTSWTFEITFS